MPIVHNTIRGRRKYQRSRNGKNVGLLIITMIWFDLKSLRFLYAHSERVNISPKTHKEKTHGDFISDE